MTFELYGYQYLARLGIPQTDQIAVMDIVISGGAGTAIARLTDDKIEYHVKATLEAYRTVLNDVASEWLDNNYDVSNMPPCCQNFM